MKKKKQKKVISKKAKKKATTKKKKKVVAVLAKPQFYNVEIELANRKTDGTTEYTYAGHPSRTEVTEEVANELADGLKAMGMGGRIIHLDGTITGTVISTWGSVERTAEAEKTEKAALETAGQN